MNTLLCSRSARLAILVALILRAGFGLIAVRDYKPGLGDPGDYVDLARSLSSGGGYVLRSSHAASLNLPPAPTALRPPAYPVFLAMIFSLFGDHLSAVVLAQAVIDTLSCVLLGLTAESLFGNVAAVSTLWWAALYPELWIHVSRLWAEGLFIALTAALFYVLSREGLDEGMGFPLATGALLGLLALTRPNGIFFTPVVALCVGRHLPLGGRLRAVCLSLLAAMLVIAPWATRNYVRFHRWIPISSGIGAVVGGAYNDAALNDRTFRGGWFLDQVIATAIRSRDDFEADERLKKNAFEWMQRHWEDLPRLAWYRTTATWWRSRWTTSEVYAVFRYPGIAPIERPTYAVTLIFAIAGLWLGRHRIRQAPYILLTIVSFTLCSCVTWGGWRLRAPIEPALVLLVGAVFERRSNDSR